MAQSPTSGMMRRDVVLPGGGQCIIRGLEGAGVEGAEGWLDAEGASDGVAHGLGANDFGTHLGGGGEGVLDFKMAGETRA